ncbi:hypothetical protein [Variovorax boronicumulans]|uniref:hypothetical protein n=1 Tax=Variovorax boronicumulans TaxID=436515 RepID=UPI00339ADBE0
MAAILARLEGWYQWLFASSQPGKNAVLEQHFMPAWENAATDGDSLAAAFVKVQTDTSEEDRRDMPAPLMVGFEITVAYCVQALKAFRRGESNLAWTFVLDAERQSEFVAFTEYSREHSQRTKEGVQFALEARHAENRLYREEVRVRYLAERENFSSKDDAAIRFVKDFPREFSTIRGWLKGL